MNILILTRSHPFKAAGIVAYDLMKSLKIGSDHKVKVLVKEWVKHEDSDIITIDNAFEHWINYILYFFYRIWRKAMRTMFKGFQTPEEKFRSNFNLDFIFEHNMDRTYYSSEKILKRAQIEPDVLIVLFMTDYISFKNLYEIHKKTGAKVILYLMDMAPITGGCHYAWDCKGYLKSCGKCPALYSNSDIDQSRRNWEFKKKYIEQTDLTVIAATEYQFRQLQNSSLFENKLKKKILLSVDQETFKPTDKTEARNYFKLPLNEKVLFFGAVTASEKRKGFKELVEALKLLKTMSPNLLLHLAIAGNASNLLTSELPYNYTLLGYLDYNSLSKAFNAADVFLSPSIEDSGPMMINQSITCGTPVIAFDIGVAQDLVINMITGYLAEIGNVKELAFGIKQILSINFSEQELMKENCLNLFSHLLSPKIQFEEFNLIINEIKN